MSSSAIFRVLVFVLLGSPILAQEYIPYRSGKLWGYVDKNGEVKIPPKFKAARMFKHGFGPVKKDHFYTMINASGDSVKPVIYDNIGEFKQGFAKFKLMGKYGYFDHRGEVAIKPQFDGADAFTSCNLAVVQKGGRYGFVNIDGKLVIPTRYQRASRMSAQGYATVYKDASAGLIDSTGKIIAPIVYKAKHLHILEPNKRLKKHFVQLKRTDGQKGNYGVIFNNGKSLLYYELNHLVSSDHFMHNKYMSVKIPSQEGDDVNLTSYGLVNYKGNIVMQTSDYAFVKSASDAGLVVGKEKGSSVVYGFVNTRGETVIKPKYESIEEFQDGLARVTAKGKYGFVDTAGALVVEMKTIGNIQFADYKYGVQRFSTQSLNGVADILTGKIIVSGPRNVHFEFTDHGLLVRREKGRFQLISPNGKAVNPTWYQKIVTGSFRKIVGKEYGFKIMQGDKVGILSKQGVVVIPPNYEEITVINDKYLKAQKNGKYGVIDYKGNQVLPFEYTGVEYVEQTGNFWVGVKLNWQMVNLENEVLTEALYSAIKHCENGFYNVYDSNWGLVDPNGKLVVPLVCREEIQPLDEEGVFGVVRTGTSLQGYIGSNFKPYWQGD